jgi:hypothetical protein
MYKVLSGCLLGCAVMGAAHANPFETIEKRPIREVWINPGMYSYHFARDEDLDDTNPGFGVEYRFNTVTSVTAGRYHNSVREMTNYVAAYYQPWKLGPVRLGAIVGVFDGYPKIRNGKVFPAVLPAASFEYKRVGVNIVLLPTVGDKVSGLISFQLKIRISEWDVAPP